MNDRFAWLLLVVVGLLFGDVPHASAEQEQVSTTDTNLPQVADFLPASAKYPIEPPDVIRVSSESAVETFGSLEYERKFDVKCVVGPDGRADLKEFGSCFVAGLTCAEVKQAILQRTKKSDCPLTLKDVHVEVLQSNSKVTYLIEKRAKRDNVHRIPLEQSQTVRELLTLAVWSQPVDFEQSEIVLKRPSANGSDVETIVPIVWQQESESADTTLLPGDRVFVTAKNEDATQPAPAAPKAPEPAVEMPNYYEQLDWKSLIDKQQILFALQLIEDENNYLIRSERLRDGFLEDEAQLQEGRLAFLIEHQLVKVLNDSTVETLAGRPASLQLEGVSEFEESLLPAITFSGTQVGEAVHFNVKTQIEGAPERNAIYVSLVLEPENVLLVRATKDAKPSRYWVIRAKLVE